MGIASRIRSIYERRPYPPPSSRAPVATSVVPSLEWLSVIREKAVVPSRILVAGCGVGTEAFAFAQRFPDAEVVGVDFSERSIAAAKRLQKTTDGGKRVRLDVADISSARLPDIAGDHFDLISCHGVLSYVPDPVAVLRNFARCVTPAGLVILGVNGAAHPSRRMRGALAGFGIDDQEFRDGRRIREVLRVFDSLSTYPQIPMADRDAGHLAGDLFGPLNRSLPLAEWNAFCRAAGLHLLGTYQAFFVTSALLNRDLHSAVIPRSRAELSELADALQPASFHQMVLSRRPAMKTPWMDAKKLLRRRLIRTTLYKIRWPRKGGRRNELCGMKLESPSTSRRVSLRVPRWEVEILRRSDGERSLCEILDEIRARVPAKSLREAMYLLYQLGAVNLLPEKP